MGRHRELNYEEIQRFIFKHYTNANPPMRQAEIAKIFRVHESTISWLVRENGLQRKYSFSKTKREKIEKEIKKGKSTKDIANNVGTNPEYVNKIRHKITQPPEERLRRQKLGCIDCLNYKTCNFVKCPFE